MVCRKVLLTPLRSLLEHLGLVLLQQGSLALRLSIVYDHVGGGDPENVL